jgi:hypothetical protein
MIDSEIIVIGARRILQSTLLMTRERTWGHLCWLIKAIYSQEQTVEMPKPEDPAESPQAPAKNKPRDLMPTRVL